MSLADAWERHADEWLGWAGTPGHDGFWESTWPELQALLPPPAGLTVELGCGEGRATRKLLAAGYDVAAFERSPTLARAAWLGHPRAVVARADASALPAVSGSAALVVACMVLQDLDNLAGTVAEVSRVLRPGGVFCFSIVHPFSSAQDPESLDGDGPVVVTRPYLQQRRYTNRVERDGLAMTFVSAHRPLSAYVDALSGASLAVDAMRELVGARPYPGCPPAGPTPRLDLPYRFLYSRAVKDVVFIGATGLTSSTSPTTPASAGLPVVPGAVGSRPRRLEAGYHGRRGLPGDTDPHRCWPLTGSSTWRPSVTPCTSCTASRRGRNGPPRQTSTLPSGYREAAEMIRAEERS